MRCIFFTLFLCVNAFASDWNNLEENKLYQLQQTLMLPQASSNSSFIKMFKGEHFHLKEIVPLEAPGIDLIMFVFDHEICTDMNLASEMEIVGVEQTNPLIEIGAQMEKCELSIFIETKDIATKSIFE